MGTLSSGCFRQEQQPKSQPKSQLKPKPQQEPQTQPKQVQEQDQEIQLYLKNSQPKYCVDDFFFQGYIGKGAFGIVFLVQLKQNMEKGITKKYALKKVSKELLKQSRIIENTKLDKQILSMNASKFIVSLAMAFQDNHYIYYVMEFATGGDTYSLINRKIPNIPNIPNKDYKALGEKAVRFIGACVILGLQFLHKNDIMYRDLKPENVLIMKNGYVKLTDFGLAKKHLQGQSNRTISGTPFYFAPQMLLKLGYTKDIDIWALGVYFYEMSVFKTPFEKDVINRNKFRAAVLQEEKNRKFNGANLSPQLKDLINKILKFDPKERLGANSNFSEIKSHDFFKDFDWKLLQQQKMKSPLTDIVNKFPVKIQPFHTKLLYQPLNEKKDQSAYKMEGWTFTKK